MAAATEDVPSCLENSKLSEQDFNLITQANDEFNKAEYDGCLQTLEQLEDSMGGSNIKVKHNRAIVKFYKSECKDYNELLLSLQNLATAEPVESESVKASCSKTTLETQIAIYNKAVIYFYKRKYYKGINILLPLMDALDDLDESTSEIIGILMLNLLIETNQLQRAQKLVELMQIQLGFDPETFALEGNSSPDNIVGKKGFTRAYKFMWLRTSVLNKRSVVVPDDGTLEIAALKAHQYYIMKDFQIAAKQLKKISEINYGAEYVKPQALNGSDSAKDLRTCVANNMGIIHLRVRHYAIAAKFFQNAITFDKELATSLHGANLQQLGVVHTREILYNLGIALLHLRRPKEAFQCFLIPLKTYHSNPRLWLRIAETCIMDYEMKSAEGEKNLLMTAGLGLITQKKISLKSTITFDSNGHPLPTSEPSLEFAVLCLRSALTLVNFYRNQWAAIHDHVTEANSDEEKPNWKKVYDTNFCNPSMPITKESFDNMLAAIYAAYSFVSLRLGDFLTAYELAQKLLNMGKLSDAHKMLAHMYSGQALIMMGRLAEARPHLDPSLTSSFNAYDFETMNWQVKSLDAAQAIIRYNLAVAMMLQGDYQLARNMLCTCTHPIIVAKAMNLKTYLDTIATPNLLS